jgi:uncharacterized protein YbjT (DUF2867 family)
MADNVSGPPLDVTPARAFVAGATGYTGRAMVHELLSRGVHTVAHIRPGSNSGDVRAAAFAGAGTIVDRSAWTPQAMRAALERHRPDVVYSLLGTTRRRSRAAPPGEPTGYDAIDYGLSSLLLHATRDVTPAAHFVYLSAAGVGPRARGGYLRARWRVEQELRDSGIRHTIIRPAFITGPDRDEDRPAERVAAAAVDAALNVAALLGARRLRERFRSRTASELAREICDRTLLVK